MSERVTEASLLFLSASTFLYLSIKFWGADPRPSLILSLIALVLMLPLLFIVLTGLHGMVLSGRIERDANHCE
jgi:hypothetical protein